MKKTKTVTDLATMKNVKRFLKLREEIKLREETMKDLLTKIIRGCEGVDSVIENATLTRVEVNRVGYKNAVETLLPKANMTPFTVKSAYWTIRAFK
jgi:aspartyl/asparaginyl-tRNA synthetase